MPGGAATGFASGALVSLHASKARTAPLSEWMSDTGSNLQPKDNLILDTDELLAVAEADQGALGGVATHIRRASFWANREGALTNCITLFSEVRLHHPDLLTGWFAVACIGMLHHADTSGLMNAAERFATDIVDGLTLDATAASSLLNVAAEVAEIVRQARMQQHVSLGDS